MGKAKQVGTNSNNAKAPPALTPEAQENELISLATNLAAEQLRTGKASSQVIVHYIKLGSTKARLELKKLENEAEFIKKKSEAIASIDEQKELYRKAMAAMTDYRGQETDDNYEDFEIY